MLCWWHLELRFLGILLVRFFEKGWVILISVVDAMFVSLLFLPFFSFFISFFFGRFLGRVGVSILSSFCVGISCSFAAFIFFEVVVAGGFCSVKLSPWISSGVLNAEWGLLFDSLTAVLLIVVLFISFLVHLYSVEYMSHDPFLPRFMSFLSLFTAFMVVLVTGDNLVQMFLGWEGIGLSSYLLINFWFSRIQANKSAMKAVIVNRIGDLGLLLGIILCFLNFKSVEYSLIFAVAPYYCNHKLCVITFTFDTLGAIGALFFIGAVGKSAQLGLHTWLPDAMEGPTPVSALIHAATLVTAGVFLLMRCSPILEFTTSLLTVIALFGGMTAFFASTVGLFQNDLKKVIAYSTCSQLGYMVFACGLSHYFVGLFHLANHAFFKALLFLSAGYVIHSMSDEQDMRGMGGLRKLLPLPYVTMLIGSLSLMGFPFLTGFYSKDCILEIAYSRYTLSGHFSFWLGLSAAFFTAFYSTRLLFLTFLAEPNGRRPFIRDISTSSWLITLPLIILCFPTVFVGFLFQDMLIGPGTPVWSNSIFVIPFHYSLTDAESLPHWVKLLPTVFSILGSLTSFVLFLLDSGLLYTFRNSVLERVIYTFINKKWFFDKVYNEFANQHFLFFSFHVSYKVLDRGVSEILGPLGLGYVTPYFVGLLRKSQSGLIYHHALFIFIGVLSLLFLPQLHSCFSCVDFKLCMFLVSFFFL